MVLRCITKLWHRKVKTTTGEYTQIMIFIPRIMSEDSGFEWKDTEKAIIEANSDTITIKKLTYDVKH